MSGEKGADDGIREIHGATPMAGNKTSPLTVREKDYSITIHEGISERFALSPASARFLARKLNRLALRIEKRQAQEPAKVDEHRNGENA